jgi:hypothetical protein
VYRSATLSLDLDAGELPLRIASGTEGSRFPIACVTSKLDYAHNQILRYSFRKIRFQKCEIRFYNSTLTFTALVRLLPHFLHFSHVLNDETVESDLVLAKSEYYYY